MSTINVGERKVGEEKPRLSKRKEVTTFVDGNLILFHVVAFLELKLWATWTLVLCVLKLITFPKTTGLISIQTSCVFFRYQMLYKIYDSCLKKTKLILWIESWDWMFSAYLSEALSNYRQIEQLLLHFIHISWGTWQPFVNAWNCVTARSKSWWLRNVFWCIN